MSAIRFFILCLTFTNVSTSLIIISNGSNFYYTPQKHFWLLFAQSAGAVDYSEPSNESPEYDTKQSDGEFPVILGLWGMRSTPSLTLYAGPLCPGLVAPDRALSMG